MDEKKENNVSNGTVKIYSAFKPTRRFEYWMKKYSASWTATKENPMERWRSERYNINESYWVSPKRHRLTNTREFFAI